MPLLSPSLPLLLLLLPLLLSTKARE